MGLGERLLLQFKRFEARISLFKSLDCPLALAVAGMNQRFTRYPPVINHNLGWCNYNQFQGRHQQVISGIEIAGIWDPRNWNWNWNLWNWNWNWNWNLLWVVELELELELKIPELELELNWKNGIDPNPGNKWHKGYGFSICVSRYGESWQTNFLVTNALIFTYKYNIIPINKSALLLKMPYLIKVPPWSNAISFLIVHNRSTPSQYI